MQTPNAPLRPNSLSYALRALGRDDLPKSFTVDSGTYTLTQVIKHDFYAATAFYQNTAGQKAVLKIGRVVPFAFVPLKWLGKFLCRREVRFYKRFADVPNVPDFLGFVGETGFAHAFVEGRPLAKDKPVPDGFFTQLRELFLELHRRNVAYVDTNKPENILLGDDGRPHLIDFQISYDLTEFGNNVINRRVVARLQHEDLYHWLKHKKRLRPDELTDEEKVEAEKKSLFIRTHRFLTKPYFVVRRKLFKRLREKGRLLPEGSK